MSARLPTMQILVSIGTVGASPQIGEILPLCDFFRLSCPVLSLPFFPRFCAQVEPLNRFSHLMAQTTCSLLGVLILWGVEFCHFPISRRSPLTQCLRYRAACDGAYCRQFLPRCSMQGGLSNRVGVCPSVCPSVTAWIVTKRKHLAKKVQLW